MKQFFVFLAGLLALASMAQSSAGPDSLAVERRDRELNELILARNARAAQEYYDDDFVLTTAAGKQKSKADMLRDISMPGLTIEANETTDVAVRVRGSTAVLTGVLHQRGELNGQRFDVRLRVTDTWHLIDGNWIILAGHASKR